MHNYPHSFLITNRFTLANCYKRKANQQAFHSFMDARIVIQNNLKIYAKEKTTHRANRISTA
ncbi:DUF1175 family protein [Ginsengibacter hankyongi]|uniref:DUF1175 family protein n=1 Tax=Ginsengibacter hankyongi TaxID=2607284 RepID=A0A5J5IM80_9BACT|nr:DUF1175 family protein [Ginsengibacter hankyongi]